MSTKEHKPFPGLICQRLRNLVKAEKEAAAKREDLFDTRDNAEQEAALLEGYQEVRPLPAFTTEQYEAMVASRNLVLLNDVLTTNNAEFIEMLPRYVPNSLTKLRAYLDTGVFRHDVAGLERVAGIEAAPAGHEIVTLSRHTGLDPGTERSRGPRRRPDDGRQFARRARHVEVDAGVVGR